jgi:hypothetical protein
MSNLEILGSFWFVESARFFKSLYHLPICKRVIKRGCKLLGLYSIGDIRMNEYGAFLEAILTGENRGTQRKPYQFARHKFDTDWPVTETGQRFLMKYRNYALQYQSE